MADVYGKWVWPVDVARPMAEGYGREIRPGAGESERGGEANELIFAERIPSGSELRKYMKMYLFTYTST